LVPCQPHKHVIYCDAFQCFAEILSPSPFHQAGPRSEFFSKFFPSNTQYSVRTPFPIFSSVVFLNYTALNSHVRHQALCWIVLFPPFLYALPYPNKSILVSSATFLALEWSFFEFSLPCVLLPVRLPPSINPTTALHNQAVPSHPFPVFFPLLLSFLTALPRIFYPFPPFCQILAISSGRILSVRALAFRVLLMLFFSILVLLLHNCRSPCFALRLLILSFFLLCLLFFP